MKYHSLQWWFVAIKEQFKHIIRNILCRKLLKIEFGYTKADLFGMYVVDNQKMLYNILIKKYPELQNIHKYLLHGTASTVMEFTSVGLFYYTNKTISVFWTNEGTTEDIIFLLKHGYPCNISIRNVLGTPHSLCIVGYDRERNVFIYNDPLGDPWTKYQFVLGTNIEIKIEKLVQMTNNKIRINFFIPNESTELKEQIKHNFKNRKIYFLEPEDYEKGCILEKKKFTFIKYTNDGRINIELDLGDEAKKHFIHFYGEYNEIENTEWNNMPPIDIMNTITKFRIKRNINI
jgi:hypothetical protein